MLFPLSMFLFRCVRLNSPLRFPHDRSQRLFRLVVICCEDLCGWFFFFLHFVGRYCNRCGLHMRCSYCLTICWSVTTGRLLWLGIAASGYYLDDWHDRMARCLEWIMSPRSRIASLLRLSMLSMGSSTLPEFPRHSLTRSMVCTIYLTECYAPQTWTCP